MILDRFRSSETDDGGDESDDGCTGGHVYGDWEEKDEYTIEGSQWKKVIVSEQRGVVREEFPVGDWTGATFPPHFRLDRKHIRRCQVQGCTEYEHTDKTVFYIERDELLDFIREEGTEEKLDFVNIEDEE